MTRAQTITAGLAALLFAAGVAATAAARPPWLFGEAGVLARISQWARDAGAPEPPAADARADPLGFLPARLVETLVRPQIHAASPFVRLARIDPKRFCDAVAGATGLRNATFHKPEPPLLGWTCVTDLVKPIDGDEQRVSSLFIAARGLESDRIDNIRIKLNLLDDATSPVARAIARDVLFEICRGLGFEPPADVLAQLERLQEGRVFEGGVSWDLRREFGPAARYNLIAVFPRTLQNGGEDRFVMDVRRQPVSR